MAHAIGTVANHIAVGKEILEPIRFAKPATKAMNLFHFHKKMQQAPVRAGPRTPVMDKFLGKFAKQSPMAMPRFQQPAIFAENATNLNLMAKASTVPTKPTKAL